MNNTIIKIKLYAFCFLITGSLLAQQKLTKVSQSINVNKDVVIDLNTSHTNIIIDTWNKSTVEIEAYIEGEKLNKEELKEALKLWDVDIDATNDKVSIKTKGEGGSNVWTYSTSSEQGDSDAVNAMLTELKFEIAELPEMNFDFHFDMPEMAEMPEFPELPELPEGVGSMEFDYKAYKRDGDKYLEKYSQKFENLYGEDYAKKMEAWGERFGEEWGEKYGKKMEEWAKNFESKMNSEEYTKKMEAWGEKFGEDYGKKMEAWGERFAAQMERQAERIEAQAERTAAEQERLQDMHEKRVELHKKVAKEHEKHAKEREKLAEKRRVLVEKLVSPESNSNVKKTIKIKMPKGAKLKVNVRHGEIEFAANIDNLKADLSHTKFTAYSVNGSSTSINASYSPVHVTNWNLGELNLNYVKNVELKNVKHLVLNSISSNIDIENLIGSAVVDGNIGDLNILNIDDAFSNLNVILQNIDAVIKLPKVDYNLQYKGTRSRFVHPKKTSKDNTSNFSTGDLANGKSIVVNAKYSNITMQ
ncbi:hypothetical protein SAMN05428642_104257 [Flaviramulus basaltis]|uniref:Adhesin domain-containing protein n=1 Tax=Flaviramulus basaltis TaxID=369401 RepID=A0A1K2IQ44_9FLAO|nr:hypothetical protein [Flaviramulus basaltis]SFZ94573.1 hypothetical protein SAMN05428642_104257 [Flaviramulus basaltis]